MPSDEMPMLNVNAFVDIQPINEGAYARLFKARRNGQWWCLKCLREEYQGQPFYEGLLRKEYDLLCRLSHSGVVRAVALEQVGNLGQCIVEEYVVGQTLDVVKGSRAERYRWFLQLIEIVGYIHSQQVVHRDLKPQNVMITDNGQHVKLLDFGLADADNYAELKQAAGTLRYVSPEQQAGGDSDFRNDIYSLGVILEELRLGAGFRFVVARCKRPLSRRYKNASALLQALRYAHFLPTALLLLMSLSVAFVCGLFSWTKPVETIVPPSSAEIAVEKVQDTSDSIPQAESTTVLATAPVAPASTPAAAAPATSQPMAEDVYDKACSKVDQYILSTHYAQLLDTLQHEEAHEPPFQGRRSRRYGQLSTAHSDFMVRLWAQVDTIRRQYIPQIGVTQSSALHTALVFYVQEKYTNILLSSLLDYADREQAYHDSLRAD